MTRFQRTAFGMCLISAPAALFAGTLVHPGLRGSATAQLELIAHNPDRWYLNHLLGLTSMVLFIPAMLGLVHLLRDRAPAWGYAGSALGVIGTIGFTGVMTIFGFVGWQMATSGDQTRMAELFARINGTAGVAIPFRVMPFAFVIGMGCFAIGLYRCGIVRLRALPIAAGPVLFGVGAQAEHVGLMIPGSGMMLVGLGSVGLALLREPEDRRTRSRSRLERPQREPLRPIAHGSRDASLPDRNH